VIFLEQEIKNNMTKKQEITNQVKSFKDLVKQASFLSDFQKKNYKVLIDYYGTPAINSATDYDREKAIYDSLAANDPQKLKRKALMDQYEEDLQPNQEALNNLEKEINDMKDLLNLLTQINNDNQTIKVDLSSLVTKADLEEVKTNLTSTTSKVTEIKTVVEELKGKPNLDLAPTNTKLDNLQTLITNLKPTDLNPTNTKIDTLSENLSNLTKGSETAQNKRIANSFIKNSQALQSYKKDQSKLAS
jgi:DNA repair ATPase RecN